MTKAEEWTQHITLQGRSGKSIAQYCRDEGISEGAFSYHKRQQRGVSESRKAEARFVQISGKDECIEIIVGEDLSVRLPLSYGLEKVMEALCVLGE